VGNQVSRKIATHTQIGSGRGMFFSLPIFTISAELVDGAVAFKMDSYLMVH
jgi:hypothetical protein